MKFAWIPAGTFLMGSPETEEGRGEDETQHPVTLSKGFYLATHLVTQAAWQEVTGDTPVGESYGTDIYFPGSDMPVETDYEYIVWEDCLEFLRMLSERDGHAYRLPTEAEWEYACRAGTTTPYFFGETISTDQANYDGRYPYCWGKEGVFRDEPTPVGSFPPNAFGLYDMHGNFWERCQDWYGDYPKEAVVDPQGPGNSQGKYTLCRGGQFDSKAGEIRSAKRWKEVGSPGRHIYVGFRPAMTP
jgi:formylglycine-generating enzyme required for sulfatase activity